MSGPGLRTIEIDLHYQNEIPKPPQSVGNLYERACSADGVTVQSWKPTWITNFKANKDRFGNLGQHSYGCLHGKNYSKPAIVIGSGPSLRYSVEALKENKGTPFPVLAVSCLHNYSFLEDNECHADYYFSLDSGEIVLTDVCEGGQKEASYY